MLSALIAAGAGLTRVVIHYVKKNTLIDECTKDATGGRVIYVRCSGIVITVQSTDLQLA
jgi:hypothetical protein